MHHTYTVQFTIHAPYTLLSNNFWKERWQYIFSITYGCTVHAWCIKNKIQQTRNLKNKFLAFVWCMYGAFMPTKIIQRRTIAHPYISINCSSNNKVVWMNRMVLKATLFCVWKGVFILYNNDLRFILYLVLFYSCCFVLAAAVTNIMLLLLLLLLLLLSMLCLLLLLLLYHTRLPRLLLLHVIFVVVIFTVHIVALS